MPLTNDVTTSLILGMPRRRAERKTVDIVQRKDMDANVQKYLNRLSDYLFVAARYAAKVQNQPEILYKKAKESKD